MQEILPEVDFCMPVVFDQYNNVVVNVHISILNNSNMVNNRVPNKYRDYGLIHWPSFIADAVGSGDQRKYCATMNVCHMVYYQRKKEYIQCDDPDNYTFVKKTNINKRTLTISAERNCTVKVNSLRQQRLTPTKKRVRKLMFEELAIRNVTKTVCDSAIYSFLKRNKFKWHRVQAKTRNKCTINIKIFAGIKTENILDNINNVIVRHKQSLPLDKKMCLILDSANHHKNSDVLQLLFKHNIEILYIPPNCTGAIQVNDLVVFSNVKAKARQQFAESDMSAIIYDDIISLTAKFLYDVEPYIIKYAFDYVCNADATLFYNSKNVFKHIKQKHINATDVNSIVDTMLSLNTSKNTTIL